MIKFKMKWNDYGKLINNYPNQRCDVSPLFSDPRVFSNLIKDLIKPFKDIQFDKIVALDALGFILGGAMALKAKKPLVLARKAGKLPSNSDSLIKIDFKDYTKSLKSFEMYKDSIKMGDRVIIVDEWIETGTQIKSVIELVEKQGGIVVGISAINADRNDKTEILFEKYNCKPLRAH